MEKTIAKNAIFNMAYKALSVIFPLIIVSYASRKLGADGIGEVSSAQNLVTYFTMFAALGIPSYGVRAIAQTKKNKDKCYKTFTELFVINLCSTIICTLLYFILLKNIDLKIRELNYIFSILIILNVFNVEWVYEGFEKYKYIAIRSFVVKALSLIALFVFVKDETDLLAYALIVCFGTAGNYILNLFTLQRYVRFKLVSLELTKHLKAIVTFLGAVIAIELYSLLDITMLTYASTAENVGYYSNAAKIVKMLANTITAIGAVMLPRLSLCFLEKKYSDIQQIIRNFLNATLTLAIPAMLGTCMVSREIVFLLFGAEFAPSIATISILSPLIVLMPLSGGIFGQLLLTSENEKKYLICVGGGAIINYILNIVFIPCWAQNGAALASVITECIVNVMMITFSARTVRINVDISEIVKIVGSAVIMMLALGEIKIICASVPILLSLGIQVIIAIAIYILCLLIFKQKFISEIIVNIKEKIGVKNF